MEAPRVGARAETRWLRTALPTHVPHDARALPASWRSHATYTITPEELRARRVGDGIPG